MVDKTKLYSVEEAIELIKKTSYSKFSGTIVGSAVVRETGAAGKLVFPHSNGQTRKVVIVDDTVLAAIEAGTIDFDVLITSPAYMPKLAKYARVLGPKGLMPNPKNGTVTENPEIKKKELEKGSIALKTQKKAPVIQVVIGKTDMATSSLSENTQALMDALKGKLLKLTLAASMSPSVKVLVK